MQPGLSIYQHNSWGKGHGQLTAGGEDGNLDADPQRKALFGAGRTPRAAEGFRKVRKPAIRRGRESGGPRCQYSPSDKLLKVCKLEAIETTISFLLGSWASWHTFQVPPSSGAACTIQPGVTTRLASQEG